MKILVATDAWFPQVNGVLATYRRLADELPELGCDLSFFTPEPFDTVAMPGYREIRLAIPNSRVAASQIGAEAPDHIHIATEGPVGWMARNYCLRRGIRFTTSFHTRFPEYGSQHLGVPRGIVYAGLKRFHNAGAGLMVATPSLQRDLSSRGFRNVLPWTRGVDTNLFRPRPDRLFGNEAPFFSTSGVSRSKRTSRPSYPRTFPASKSWSAMVRTSLLLPNDFRAFASWAAASARISRATSLPLTSLSFRAGPTPSAWSSWKPWPRASLWRLTRSLDPSTS